MVFSTGAVVCVSCLLFPAVRNMGRMTQLGVLHSLRITPINERPQGPNKTSLVEAKNG